MHPEAYNYCHDALHALYGEVPIGLRVVEFGSRDVNGSVRDLFPEADYIGLDVEPGGGVDLVVDCADWVAEPPHSYDVVISTEVFEHTPRWPEILRRAYDALKSGGVLVTTCATDPRAPHSAVTGFDLLDGEYYKNVGEQEFLMELLDIGFIVRESKVHPRGDLYVTGIAE